MGRIKSNAEDHRPAMRHLRCSAASAARPSLLSRIAPSRRRFSSAAARLDGYEVARVPTIDLGALLRLRPGEAPPPSLVQEVADACARSSDETTRRFALARLKSCFGGPKAMSQALANGERLKKGILLEGIGKVEGLSPAAADVAADEAQGTSEGAAAPEVAEEVQ